MKAKIFWIHTLTPLHVGTGRGVGFIDLPIAREKLTGWPLVPGSAIKGVLRDYFEQAEIAPKLLKKAFGVQNEAETQSGSLMFTDARIVLLPVRSLYGTFAFVTSPMALQRLQRELREVGSNGSPDKIPQPNKEQLLAVRDSVLVGTDKIYLEELDFNAKTDDEHTQKWADFLADQIFTGEWPRLFKQRFAIVADDTFNYLCETGTEVNARVKIDDNSKTVSQGALWYEESLPAEAVLAGITCCDRVFHAEDVKVEHLFETFLKDDFVCQMGGKATTGKGRVRCHFSS